jgi:hypothetical protein
MQLLYNANIYTLDAETPLAPAMLIDGGRIAALGDAHTLQQDYPRIRQRLNLGGRAVIPGLVDAHIHLQHYALGLQKVNCETGSRPECLERVAARAQTTPPGEWILGHGWNQNRWQDGFGTAAELDQIAPASPVYLTAKSLHAAWASSQALRLAGVDRETPDPPGGKIGRDGQGNPDGILFENAMRLVENAIPLPGVQAISDALQQAFPVLWAMGISGVHDFDRRDCFSALQSLRLQGKLQLRVLKSIPFESLEHAAALGLRSGFGDDYLRIGSLKAFADGALGPRTAAMLQPYESEPGNHGMLLLDGEEVFEHGCAAVQNGLSLAVHAIGDRANHEVLNALAQLRAYEQLHGLPRLRHRIEHVQLIHPQDAARLANNDILASMQPIHATSDMHMADQYWGDRSRYAYAWRTQLDYGAKLVFGSDAPVESPNPFLSLHAAVTRRRLDGSPGPQGWYPEQRLSLLEALQAYTSGPAYAAGWEQQQGKLLPGYFADLVVLNEDIFQIPVEKIAHTHPLATMIGGRWVFQEPAAF